MRKSLWKDKLYIVEEDGEPLWITNGHWCVTPEIAKHVPGLRNLIALRPGVYVDHELVEGQKPPSAARLFRSVKKREEPIGLVDTGWIIGKKVTRDDAYGNRTDGTCFRVLKTLPDPVKTDEASRVVLVDNNYAEILDVDAAQKTLALYGSMIVIGPISDPRGALMIVRQIEGITEEITDGQISLLA